MNCITFADTAVGKFSKTVENESGKDIAEGAELVLSNATGDRLRDFFSEKNKSEWESKSYVFWWDGHATIIVKGIVCEYIDNDAIGHGYSENDVHSRLKFFVHKTASLAEI